MKKTLLFSLFFSASLMINAQFTTVQDTTNLGDFEDGIGSWSSFGAPVDVATPPGSGNSSDSAAYLDQTGGAWNGFSRWFNDPILDPTNQKITADVYINGSSGLIQLYMDNPESSGAANYTKQVTGIAADTWTSIEFDITDLPAHDYHQIAFQSDVEDTIYFDNIKMISEDEYFSVDNKVTAPNIIDENDFSTKAYMDWDNDSIYMTLNVLDDTIFNDGRDEVWEVDNIEIYFDMNNNKGDDIEADTTAYQFRLMNDSSWSSLNSLGGVRLDYWVDTADNGDTIGYTYDLAFLMDSLKEGFTPEVGKRIGFDILASDNDGEPDNRDQMSWNSPSPDLWNTPSYWGVIEFTGDNSFIPISQFPVENVVTAPNIMGESDFDVNLTALWDMDSIYLTLDVLDDTIFNDGRGEVWEVDNIEIYFDMNNNKGDDIEADAAAYQFRLMNDSSWSSLNGLGGVRLDYWVDTADNGDTLGYTYDLAFQVDSLLAGFTPEPGTQIGFDILASDNDGEPDNRDQISWNSPSPDLWNTPYYWGTLEFQNGNTFKAIPDEEAPTTPANFAAAVDEASVSLSWDASTDNIWVGGYIISQDGSAIDTVSGTSATVDELADGDYTFGVVAMDIYNNKSEEVTADATVDNEVGIEHTDSYALNIYPNPVTSQLFIESDQTIESIEIVDVTGKSIQSLQGAEVIDVSQLNPGLYMIQVHTKNEIHTATFIKQ